MAEKLKTKKLYSIPELYSISVKAFLGSGDLKRGRASGFMDSRFQERIMLAVTAVNECEMCSYAHTELALKAGMSDEEIRAFAAGDVPDIPDEQVKAVLFAQHYVDVRGKIHKDVWDALIKEYGPDSALCILAVTRTIMFGNSFGVVLSSVKNRIKKGRGDSRSNPGYELAVILCTLPILILAFLQALIMKLFRISPIKFS